MLSAGWAHHSTSPTQTLLAQSYSQMRCTAVNVSVAVNGRWVVVLCSWWGGRRGVRGYTAPPIYFISCRVVLAFELACAGASCHSIGWDGTRCSCCADFNLLLTAFSTQQSHFGDVHSRAVRVGLKGAVCGAYVALHVIVACSTRYLR
jgi:hypothetical protein